MDTIELATTVAIGTALVFAPIAPQAVRDLNTPAPAPAREPEPKPVPEPTVVANYDHYGTLWGYDTVTKAEADIAQAHAHGHTIDEWNVTDRDGQPLRIVRTTDPTSTFLGGIDISVIPVTATAPATLDAHQLATGHELDHARREPHIGDLVEILTATHAEPGIIGRLTAIDPHDPTDRYRVQGATGPVAWATTIRRLNQTA